MLTGNLESGKTEVKQQHAAHERRLETSQYSSLSLHFLYYECQNDICDWLADSYQTSNNKDITGVRDLVHPVLRGVIKKVQAERDCYESKWRVSVGSSK